MCARRRTRQWDDYLGDAIERTVTLSAVNLLGIPPPLDVPDAWIGRQVVLLSDHATQAMAEVQDMSADQLTLRLPAAVVEFDTLLIRDATRTADGVVETARPFAAERIDYLPPGDLLAPLQESGGARVTCRVGAVDVALVNGVFGDPLLHLRLCHQRRSLLFDLGQCEQLDSIAIANGVICDEAGFRIRAVTLDHHQVPVIAYAFEPARQLNIRKNRLLSRRLEPGPWLTELKQRLLADNANATIELPDGTRETAAALGAQLVLVTPGKKLAYATDLADTPANREQLPALAQHAHTFFCEAPFLQANSEQARCTGHLTTRACGEIAAAAGVARLVPFHFSRRYSRRPQAIYAEIEAVCSNLVAPKTMALFADARTDSVMELD